MSMSVMAPPASDFALRGEGSPDEAGKGTAVASAPFDGASSAGRRSASRISASRTSGSGFVRFLAGATFEGIVSSSSRESMRGSAGVSSDADSSAWASGSSSTVTNVDVVSSNTSMPRVSLSTPASSRRTSNSAFFPLADRSLRTHRALSFATVSVVVGSSPMVIPQQTVGPVPFKGGAQLLAFCVNIKPVPIPSTLMGRHNAVSVLVVGRLFVRSVRQFTVVIPVFCQLVDGFCGFGGRWLLRRARW